jgi:hypothetical protein
VTAGSYYSDEQRREAVAHYVLLGNWRKVAEATGIPQRTLHDWSTQPWYGTLLAEVRAEKGTELEAAYTRILDKATAQLLDRVEHGDYVITNGTLVRRPVSARDLALVAGIIYDKRALARGEGPPEAQPNPTVEQIFAWLGEQARNGQRRERLGRGET